MTTLNIILLISLISCTPTRNVSHYEVKDTTGTYNIRLIEHSKLSTLTGKTFVIDNTIYTGLSKEEFFKAKWLLIHELQHVRQYRDLGTLEFLRRYILLAIIFGADHPMERDPKVIRL